MNTTILTKCIEELKADNPDISYIRGALETLLAMSPQPMHAYGAGVTRTGDYVSAPSVSPLATEGAADPALDRYLNGPTGTVTTS